LPLKIYLGLSVAFLFSHSREHPQQSLDRDFPVFINKSFGMRLNRCMASARALGSFRHPKEFRGDEYHGGDPRHG